MGARVGTAKGVTDFLDRYAGTRFLHPRGENGVEFLPTPAIAVSVGLDDVVQPRLRYSFAFQYGMIGARTLSADGNDLYMIANNYLPKATRRDVGSASCDATKSGGGRRDRTPRRTPESASDAHRAGRSCG